MSIFDLLPLQNFPDEWYNPFETAIVGSGVWVLAALAMVYVLLKWRLNSQKFYAALARQEAAKEGGGEMGGGR